MMEMIESSMMEVRCFPRIKKFNSKAMVQLAAQNIMGREFIWGFLDGFLLRIFPQMSPVILKSR